MCPHILTSRDPSKQIVAYRDHRMTPIFAFSPTVIKEKLLSNIGQFSGELWRINIVPCQATKAM
jgi:hypothetical protein